MANGNIATIRTRSGDDRLAPGTGIRRIDAGEHLAGSNNAQEHYPKRATMATKVATCFGPGAEDRGVPAIWMPLQLGEVPVRVRDGVPDHEGRPSMVGVVVEEYAAMAGIDGAAVAAVELRHVGVRGRGDELARVYEVSAGEIAEQALDCGYAMELAESAAEAGIGDEAAPCLADEGGFGEARGIVRRESEENLFHQLVRQRRHANGASKGFSDGYLSSWHRSTQEDYNVLENLP